MKKANKPVETKKAKVGLFHKHHFERAFILNNGKYYVADVCPACGTFKNLNTFEYEYKEDGSPVTLFGSPLSLLQARYGRLKIFTTNNLFGNKCDLLED